MIKEAETSSTLSAREDVSEKKRSALRLVSSPHPALVEDEPAPVVTESRSLPARAIHPAFLVRDERFTALHPRRVFSRQRRRGSYVFHC
ncbi:hypothetical protein [Hydrocarboniphaga sp.]|uniref:hypothetical protein n=1 Tax=Hydrocarboniphaga sp. TaxID=2033016 RepID=UPI003D0DA7EB